MIQKIFRLEQLTIDDIKELEEICWKELGSKEEYDALTHRRDSIDDDDYTVDQEIMEMTSETGSDVEDGE